MKKNDNAYITARSVIALLIILIAFSILIIFNNYQDNIIFSNSFSLFAVLTIIEMGLLVTLLHLVNPHHKAVIHQAVKKTKKTSRKKKR